MKYLTTFVAAAVLIAFASGVARAGDSSPTPAPAGHEIRRWEVTGPFGGSVRSLVVAPDDAQRIFIGTSDGQLYRSRDGGRTWARTIPGFSRPGLVLDNLLIDPADPQVMYLGVWSVGNDKLGGIFKSKDGGDTWDELDDMHRESVRALTIDANNSGLLVAGTLSGVFRSADEGKHWQRISPENHPDLINVESVAIDPRDPNIIYAGTTHLPWKTTDGGATWTPIKNGMLDDSDVFSIAILNDAPDQVFASACSGIYKSENAGQTWAKVQGIPFSSRRTHIIFPHPTRPEVVFAGTTQGLWRTTDSGKTWQLMTTKTLVVNSIDIHPTDPNTVILGTDEHGVLISRDLGQSFVESNTGFIHRHILSILPDATAANRVYATVFHDGVAGGLFVSEDGGKSWRQSIKGLGGRDVFTLFQDPDNPLSILAGTNYGVYRSVDHAESWAFVGKIAAPAPVKKGKGRAAPAAVENFGAPRAEPQRRGKPAAKAPAKKAPARSAKKRPAKQPKEPAGPQLVTIGDQVNGFARFTDADGVRWLIAAANSGIYRTRDADKGWEKIPTPGLAAPFTALSTVTNDPERVIYVGTIRGLAFTRDFGATWEEVHRGPEGVPVKSVIQDPRDPNTIYVGARGAFYKSADGGRSWRKRGGGLPDGDITVVAVDPLDPDIIYAGDYRIGGIYRSRNKGEFWERLDSGLPSERVWTIAADPFDAGRVYAGSFSGGVYVLTVNPQSAKVENQ